MGQRLGIDPAVHDTQAARAERLRRWRLVAWGAVGPPLVQPHHGAVPPGDGGHPDIAEAAAQHHDADQVRRTQRSPWLRRAGGQAGNR